MGDRKSGFSKLAILIKYHAQILSNIKSPTYTFSKIDVFLSFIVL